MADLPVGRLVGPRGDAIALHLPDILAMVAALQGRKYNEIEQRKLARKIEELYGVSV